MKSSCWDVPTNAQRISSQDVDLTTIHTAITTYSVNSGIIIFYQQSILLRIALLMWIMYNIFNSSYANGNICRRYLINISPQSVSRTYSIILMQGRQASRMA